MSANSSGFTEAILREIAGLLDRLIDTGEEGVVDLRSLPIGAADRDTLRSRLGTGEVRAALDIAGASTVEETGIFGVWWVRHEGANDGIAYEQIVVSRVPTILVTHPCDLAIGASRLRGLIAADGSPPLREAAR